MIEKLKEASKILLVPAAILYLFGFICLNAYYARFGIVSFDIINSRFIIAGFYPLISLIAVILLAWYFYKMLPYPKPFGIENWKQRFTAYFLFILFTLSAAFILSLILNIGVHRVAFEQESLVFKPIFGGYDYIGNHILRMPIDMSGGANYVLKTCLNLFPYLFLLALLMAFLKPIIKRNLATQELGVSSKKQNGGQLYTYSSWCFYPILIVDILMISLYIAIVYYSYRKIHVEIFDFKSFTQYQPLTPDLLFFWIFPSTLLLYLFLMNTRLPAEQLKLSFTEYVSDYGLFQYALQQLIIPMLISVFLFGITIFPRIPFATGGGAPRLIKLMMSDSSHDFNDEKMYLIGESNQFFFVIAMSDNGEKGRALQINKSTVAYIETKSTSEQLK